MFFLSKASLENGVKKYKEEKFCLNKRFNCPSGRMKACKSNLALTLLSQLEIN